MFEYTGVASWGGGITTWKCGFFTRNFSRNVSDGFKDLIK